MQVKRFRITALSVIGLVMMTAASHAEADGPDFFKVTGIAPSKALNLRAGPGINHPVIGRISSGTDGIRNLGCEGGLNLADWQSASLAERAAALRQRWCRVSVGALEGWAAGRFLAEGSGSEEKSTPQTAASQPEVRGTEWILAGSPAGEAVGNAWLRILPSGDINGNAGCNNFFASGSFGAGAFKLTSPIGATRKLCPENDVSDQETKLFSALERAAKYDFDIKTGTLWVMDETDETLLEFRLKQ